MTRRWIAMQMTAEAQAINKSALHAFRICSGRGFSVVGGPKETVIQESQAMGARRISGQGSEVSYTNVAGDAHLVGRPGDGLYISVILLLVFVMKFGRMECLD